MRVLVVAERLGRSGGMERYLEIVLPALAARGAVVHVLAREIDGAPPGVEATCVAWSDEHAAPDPAARAATARAVRAMCPDVTVAHNVMDAGVVEALRDAPRFAYHVHDHRPFCPNGDRLFPRTHDTCVEPLGAACAMHAVLDGCAYGPRRRTLELIRRRERLRDAVARADTVVVASAYVAERAAASGIARERILTVPLPLPDAAYAACATEDKTFVGDGSADATSGSAAAFAASRRTIVFAGRIVAQKGLCSLIRALARIEPQRRPVLRAFGTGPDLSAALAEAASLGVALETPGVANETTLREALDEAALLVMPSLWAEPFGYVGIEAFARGRTVVAYDVGGVRAWLADGTNGIAVAAGEESRLATAIATLLDDEPLRTQLARQARTDAERYRAAPIVNRLFTAYQTR